MRSRSQPSKAALVIAVALGGPFIVACPASPPPSARAPAHADFEHCEANAECASGFCARRVCVPHECDVDDDCDDGSVCAASNLIGNICAPPAARGDDCFTWNDTGDRSSVTCAEGLDCVDPGIVGFAGSSVCVPPDGPRLTREPCDDAHACEIGLVCDQVCLGEVGTACAAFEDCESRRCSEIIGACVANECGAAGENCGGELICMNAECGNKCLPLVAPGDACRSNDLCADVLFCASGVACGADGRCP